MTTSRKMRLIGDVLWLLASITAFVSGFLTHKVMGEAEIQTATLVIPILVWFFIALLAGRFDNAASHFKAKEALENSLKS